MSRVEMESAGCDDSMGNYDSVDAAVAKFPYPHVRPAADSP